MLADLALEQARIRPDSPAVRGSDRIVTYRELDHESGLLAHQLEKAGVRPGDRVGIWLDKTPLAVASILATLRMGAAYVPIDPLAPIRRARMLMHDCAVRAVVTSGERIAATEAIATVVDPTSLGSIESATNVPRDPGDLAYVLYTSGSTGTPKGVAISHGAARAFVDWASGAVGVSPEDRLASHAPLHFDLSIFDLFVAFAAGASVSLVPESLAYSPAGLVEWIANESITIWYSVPSALMLMIEQGGLLETPLDQLRAVLFAGEPFPIAPLRRLRAHLTRARFYNFYGPTETNVCTSYEVTEIAPSRGIPMPIGRACAGNRVRVVREDGAEAEPGEEGELWVEGPTVMLGYFGEPALGASPYRTGDIVRVEPDGELFFVGRRDDIVKVRGNRIALGEIEASLQAHPDVREAAVVVRDPGTLAASLTAFLVARGSRPNLLALKAHCAERLPRAMIVDRIRFVDALPRTPNGKVDRAELVKKDLITHDRATH